MPGTPLRVGVTGHRRIDDPETVMAAVDEVLCRLAPPAAPGAQAGPDAPAPTLDVVSPLAAGADRLVALAALARPDAALSVVLPFPAEDYARDFATRASRAEFQHLLARARRVDVLPAATSRDAGYEQVGRWVVDHCDVLLALWDGRPSRKRGGTAETIAYARAAGVPIQWVLVNAGPVVVERL